MLQPFLSREEKLAWSMSPVLKNHRTGLEKSAHMSNMQVQTTYGSKTDKESEHTSYKKQQTLSLTCSM